MGSRGRVNNFRASKCRLNGFLRVARKREGTINSFYLLDYDDKKALYCLLLVCPKLPAKSVSRRARGVGGKKIGNEKRRQLKKETNGVLFPDDGQSIFCRPFPHPLLYCVPIKTPALTFCGRGFHLFDFHEN